MRCFVIDYNSKVKCIFGFKILISKINLLTQLLRTSFNQRTNGPVNAHLRYIPINLFDLNGNIHVYNPRAGSEQPLESISLLNHKDLVHLPI